MNRIFTTRNTEDRNTCTFLMIISITHEIGHCFTGYLTGCAEIGTPSRVGVPGREPEAGYSWEAGAFGGLVAMWGDPQRGLDQTGTPYLFADQEATTTGTRVSTRYIERFIDGSHGMLQRQVSTSLDDSLTH